MSTLVPVLISWLQLYGYPVLWICVFFASVGAPLPIGLVLLATGAFAALGDFNIFLLVAVTSSASVCGDSFGYLLGRKIGRRLLIWLAQSPTSGSAERAADREAKDIADFVKSKKRRIRFISPRVIERSQEYFQQHGAWAILLSRCVVPALGGTINILAGAERYPYQRFLLYDISGEIIGAALPLTLGYIFGVSWEAVGVLLTTISLLILALLVVVYLTFLLIRMLRRMRVARHIKRHTQMESVTEIRSRSHEDELERQM